jgi:ABC-type dipeptide/oligopeptide/nickel transport system ATPase component
MSNALQPIFDLFWDAGKIFFTWVFDGWIEPKKSLDVFFKAANIKNSLGEYPEVVIDNKTVFVVFVPAGLSVDDFLKHKDALELYLNNEVKMEASSGWGRIEMLKKLPKVIEYEIQNRTAKHIKFNIGKSSNKTITLDLKENPHTYVVGTTGSGKSVMTKVILTSIVNLYSPNKVELYLCDLKMVELNLFRNLQHTKKFVYTVEDTTEVISNLLEETRRRYNLFMENEVTNIFEYNKLKGVKKLKYQVLYIEEIVMLLEDKNKSAMKLLKQLIAISRASGCYVFLTTQRPDNTVIDNIVKANINNRIVLKCEDRKNSEVALDEEGAEKLRGNGHGFIKNGANIEEFQGYFITDDQVKDYTLKYQNKGTSKSLNFLKDKLQDEGNKNVTEANEKVKKLSDLSFLDKL